MWWNIFIQSVQPKLRDDCSGLAATLAKLDLSPEGDSYGGGYSHAAQDTVSRRKAWEAGHIDYLGGDSFQNIQKKLDESIRSGSKGSSSTEPQREVSTGGQK